METPPPQTNVGGATPGGSEIEGVKEAVSGIPVGNTEETPSVGPGAPELSIMASIEPGDPDRSLQTIAAGTDNIQAVRTDETNKPNEQGEKLEHQEKPWPGQEWIKEGKPLPYHQITDRDHSGDKDILIMNQQGEVVAWTYAEVGFGEEVDLRYEENIGRLHQPDKVIADIQKVLTRRGLDSYSIVVDQISNDGEARLEEVGVDFKDLTGGKEADDDSYATYDWMDIGSSYVDNQDKMLKLPHNQREGGVVEMINLVKDPAFEDRFVRVQTATEQAQIRAVVDEVTKTIENRLRPYKEAAAAASLGVASVEEGRRRGKEWGDALRQVTEIRIETGDVIPIEDGPAAPGAEPRKGARSLIKDQIRPEFEAKMNEARQRLQEAEAQQRQLLDTMRQELAGRRNDPTLLDAMDVWGRSPDARGNRGARGQGLHAGVMHYMEYRGDQGKNGRYKETESVPSVDGFIQYSNRLKGIVNNPNPTVNPDVQQAALIGDEEGQRRLYALGKTGELIVGFQKPGEETMRVVTVIPGQAEKNFQKSVQDEVNKTGITNRLNELGEQRKILQSSLPPASS